MKKRNQRILKGNLVIVFSMIGAIIGTLLYDYCVKTFGHEDRFSIIFGVGGGLLAICSICIAISFWTNHFGEGFND